METIIGHDKQLLIAGLPTSHLPPSLLLKGPAGVGKGFVARQLAAYGGVSSPYDLLVVDKLNPQSAQDVLSFSHSRPVKGVKVASVNLDGAYPGSFNRLLKLAEEPPQDFHFIFRAVRKPPLTIESRSQVVSLGPLSDDDLMTILVDKMGWQPAKADSVIPLAQGSLDGVQDALALVSQRDTVEVYLNAVVKKDPSLGAASLRSFRTDEEGRLALRLARVWCGEAISGRWRVFSKESLTEDLRKLVSDPEKVRRLYLVLCQKGHPRVIARAGLALV